MDIDIDFPDRSKVLAIIKHIKASKLTDGEITSHNTGIYLQTIPYNPVTNLANIDYKTAEQRGYFKIDFLNVSVYNGVKNHAHLNRLMEIEPLWDLLEQEEFVNLLFHLNGHCGILRTMKPKNIQELAAVLAIIRPAKRHLLGLSWNEVFEDVWNKPTTGEYYFKKAHAIGYAMAIVVQMNLICEEISYDYS
jgi:DNA polymerase III alpha subunit